MNAETEPDPTGTPAPTLRELMKERRELWEKIMKHHNPDGPSTDADRMMDAYMRLNFTIDELLAMQVTSTRDVQKFAAQQYGELRAQVQDMAEAQS